MLANMSLIILILLFIGLTITYFFDRHFINVREWELVEQSKKTASILQNDLAGSDMESLRKTASTIALSSETKIRIIDTSGENIMVVDFLEEAGENYISSENVGLRQREIDHVLAGNIITKKIYGPEMNFSLVAVPVSDPVYSGSYPSDEHNNGVLTLSKPLSGISETMGYFSRLFILTALAGLAFAMTVSFFFSRKITSPIKKINQTANEMAQGDFTHNEIASQGSDEMGRLLDSFNYAVREVEKTLDEQRKLEELRRNLIANVSHELRAPLSSMLGFIELIIDGKISVKEQNKYLEIIMDNTLHLSRLVDDLMELSRLESGSLSLIIEKINMCDVIERTVDSIIPEAERRGFDVQLEIADYGIKVMGDENRLYQVFTNLLKNVFDHMADSGKITIKMYKSDGDVITSVTDNGFGIPVEEQPLIWERFYKLDPSRKRGSGGSGLGLSITKQLVEMHGGTVYVENNEGSGCTFTVNLPAAD